MDDSAGGEVEVVRTIDIVIILTSFIDLLSTIMLGFLGGYCMSKCCRGCFTLTHEQYASENNSKDEEDPERSTALRSIRSVKVVASERDLENTELEAVSGTLFAPGAILTAESRNEGPRSYEV